MFEFEKEFYSIIKGFHRNGELDHFVLVGSWCLLVYRNHYPISQFTFNTSDVDFSIYRPQDLQKKASVSIHELLLKMGYVPKFSVIDNAEKFIPAPLSPLNNLNIEFLCEPGRHIQEPFRLTHLGITTTPLKYQKILLENSIRLTFRGLPIKVPSPIVWAIHKIAISQCRKGKDAKLKQIKDLEGALVIVKWLGKESIMMESKRFKGKFLRLFQKGWQILQDREV